MNQNYQEQATNQICKIQTDKKLIALYDRLAPAPYACYAQLHAKGEYFENDRRISSLIGIIIQDYSNGTGEKNVIVKFNLSPEQVQFFLSRITAGFQDYEWSQSKIFGEPDSDGLCIAQQFSISRHSYDQNGQRMNNPWRIQIINGKGIKVMNRNGGSYMKSQSFIAEKIGSIQLNDMDIFTLFKRTDSYIAQWERWISHGLISDGKQLLVHQQAQRKETI